MKAPSTGIQLAVFEKVTHQSNAIASKHYNNSIAMRITERLFHTEIHLAWPTARE